MIYEDNFMDLRPPKSPRRFFSSPFSSSSSPSKSSHANPAPPLPPLPPLPNMALPPTPTGTPYTPPTKTHRKSHTFHTPSSSTSSGGFGLGLGYGAQVVRTPSEALRGIPTTPSSSATGPKSPDEMWGSPGRSAGLRHQRSDLHSALGDRPSVTGGAGTARSPSMTSGKSEYSLASVGSSAVTPTITLAGDKYRKRQSVSQRDGRDAKDGRDGRDAQMARDEYRLMPKVSLSSLNEPATPSPSPHVHNFNKKYGHISMSPTPKLQASFGRQSTFDPFGLKPTESKPSPSTYTPPPSSTPVSARDERRATLKAPRPVTTSPFHAILKGKTTKSSPTSKSETLVTLEFGYSLDETPKNTSVTLPWAVLAKAGGHLVRFIKDHLGDEEEEKGVPDMTDGSSAEDSDRDSGSYDLEGLLREKYLKSLWISSPSLLEFPVPPPVPPMPRSGINPKTGKKRAATRNQYIQQAQFPSPSSPFTHHTAPLAIRRQAAQPIIEVQEADGGGVITELTVLITRDAAVYHLIAARLSTGDWIKMDSSKKKRVEEECAWLGMGGLAGEMAELLGRSMVLRGGSGYI